MAGMNYVCLYISYLESLAPFSDDEIGRMVKAMFRLIRRASCRFPARSRNKFLSCGIKAV